jgi:hypothetical protein
MSKPTKKSASKFPKKASASKSAVVAKAKAKRKIPQPASVRSHGWMIAGFDISLSSMAGAAIAYDSTLKKFKGPVFVMHRWSTEDHYFDRLEMAARSHELVLDLQAALGISIGVGEVFIAQEEPFPPHGSFMKGGASGALKQQAEISGAFLGGLLRYGYKELWQMGNMDWRRMVAAMISEETGEDVTTYHAKWKSPKLAAIYNCAPKDSGKFRAKQWALDVMAPCFGQQYHEPNEIPDWPDILRQTGGHKPRPEGSKAKAFQPDDRYDALAVMWALYLDLKERDQLAGLT